MSDPKKNRKPYDLFHCDTIIYAGRWAKFCEEGWRWEVNFSITDLDSAKPVVDDLVARHGKSNVAPGHPMVQNEGLVVNENAFGVYVRDVDDMMLAHSRDLDKIAGIA